MKLTGRDIHQAYLIVAPDEGSEWDNLPSLVQQRYDDVAYELNRMLEQDAVEIAEVRCPQCSAMLDAAHAEGHACWQKEMQTICQHCGAKLFAPDPIHICKGKK